jgi:superfamily II DNA/RNA helicase
VTQSLIRVSPRGKREALRALLRREPVTNALIFCNRKRDVGVLFKSLQRHGFSVGELHGDMHQSVRTETLEKFRNKEMTLLVCSDVAARGLDIDDLSHVFNFDVPIHAEDYVHRIGRTGRAGKSGRAFTLATAEDRKYVGAIERLIGKSIPTVADEGVPNAEVDKAEEPERHRRRRGSGRSSAAGERPRARSETPAEPMARAAEAPRATSNVAPFPKRPAGRRHDRTGDDGPSPIGLGDHVPAFLLRVPRASGGRV